MKRNFRPKLYQIVKVGNCYGTGEAQFLSVVHGGDAIHWKFGQRGESIEVTITMADVLLERLETTYFKARPLFAIVPVR